MTAKEYIHDYKNKENTCRKQITPLIQKTGPCVSQRHFKVVHKVSGIHGNNRITQNSL